MDFVKGSDSQVLVAKTSSASTCVYRQDETKGKVQHTVGRFSFDFVPTAMQERILARLADWYTDEKVDEVLRPILEQHKNAPSIRSLDWLLTNLCKARPIFTKQKTGGLVNLRSEYTTVLSHFRRRNFDAFRRRWRLTVHHEHGDLVSTIAQVNFYRWAHESGALDYAREHQQEIEESMNSVAMSTKEYKRARLPGQRRRSELTHAPRTSVAIYRNDS